MTISTTNSYQYFDGNGANKNFPFNMRFFSDNQIVVTRISAANVSTTLALNSDYTLTGAGTDTGGTVTTAVAPLAGEKLLVRRVLPYVQTTSLRNQGAFYPAIHEDEFDYLTMLIQQTNDSASQSLHLDEARTKWDAQGLRIANVADPIDAQDAVPKGWIMTFISSVSGAINTTLGIAYDTGTLFDFLRNSNSRTVDSVAALRLLAGSRNQRATTLGYYAKGDGGAADYYVDSADTTTADNGFTVIVGTDGARWKIAQSTLLNIHHAGAVGDGTANDTAAFNRMITAGYAIRLLPKKTYLIDNITITGSAGIFGAGQHDGGSEIRANTATGNLITFSGPAGSPMSIVEKVKFTSRVTRTSGAYVAFTGFGRCFLTDFVMWDGYLGVSVNVSTSVTIGNGLMYSATGGDIQIIAGFTLYIYNVITDHPAGTQPAFGLSISTCGDITVSDCSFIHAGNAMVMDVPDGGYITSCWFDNVFFDTSLRGAFIRSSGTGNIQRCRWDCCWFGSHANQGVLIQKLGSGSIEGLHFIDPHVVLNAGDGLRTQGAVKDISVSGGEFCANTSAGISIGTGATHVNVMGAMCGAYAGLSGNATGITIETIVENFCLIGNQVNGNTGGSISNQNPGATNSIISGNIGYRTQTRGNTTIAAGTTSTVVAHGLFETPAIQDIRLNPTSGWGAATQWWISNITSSQFTINVNNNPTVGINFGWEAKTPSSRT